MTKQAILAVTICVFLAGGCIPHGQSRKSAVEMNLATIEAISPSFVHVEYTLRYDKGEAPRAASWGSFDEYIREERPLEQAGLLLSDNKVLVNDLMMHPRFIKSIAVKAGSQCVPAVVSGYAVNQDATLLELATPLKEATPLKIDPSGKGPYRRIWHYLRDGRWVTLAWPASTSTFVDAGKSYIAKQSLAVFVDKNSTPVGVCMTSRLPTDDSWKGNPLDWKIISSEQMDRDLKNIQAVTDKAILRVALSFRSPKKSAGGGRYGRYGGGDESKTEMNVLGVLIDKKTVMVLSKLKPKVTARLERIVVHPVKGKPVEAKFDHTLKDYGCFLVKLEKPLDGAVKFSTTDVYDIRQMLMLSADVKLQGEKRVAYFGHRRIDNYQLGWKRQVYPSVSGSDGLVFVFDSGGSLLTCPISRRRKVSTEERWGDDNVLATPTHYIKTVLGDLSANVDLSNVPLTKEEENRLAWIGVVLQPLNKQLARINNVSDLTRDGEIGALVSYVYPDSPAAKAGVEMGWILLNINVEGDPKPMDVRIEEYRDLSNFPWQHWDRLPPRYWDGSFQKPWQSAENTFTRALTDLGFGKKFTATFVADGKQIKKPFSVVESPKHYTTATQYKSKALGLTVREMTYEVRRYFHKTPTDPGVIVSAVEPGSKAGVGGIRPFEIITHVNDKPVTNLKDFERLIKGHQELRLDVLRMIKGRIVRIRMSKPKPKPEANPKPKPET